MITTADQPIEVPVEASDEDKQVVVAVGVPSGLDRHTDLSVRIEDGATASSIPLTLVHKAVPAVEKQPEWNLDFEEFGHPLFESSVIHFDGLGMCASMSFYQEDASFDLNEIYPALVPRKCDLTEYSRLKHEPEAGVSLSVSSVNIYDEESLPVKLDTEEHQTDASFNIDDIYVPFEEQPEDIFTPHRARTARFVEIEPLAEDDVASIGCDAPAGEALIRTEVIVITDQDDPFRIPTSDLAQPSPVYGLNPLAKSFVPELFSFESRLLSPPPDRGNEEKGYRRRRKRPKKNGVAEADCPAAMASTSA